MENGEKRVGRKAKLDARIMKAIGKKLDGWMQESMARVAFPSSPAVQYVCLIFSLTAPTLLGVDSVVDLFVSLKENAVSCLI
ncbi:hypothetical protein K1719_008081 [Acacia pycnantha]|nr:hypothetical protein K1719_008081 [Acacia pycnantha]